MAKATGFADFFWNGYLNAQRQKEEEKKLQIEQDFREDQIGLQKDELKQRNEQFDKTMQFNIDKDKRDYKLNTADANDLMPFLEQYPNLKGKIQPGISNSLLGVVVQGEENKAKMQFEARENALSRATSTRNAEIAHRDQQTALNDQRHANALMIAEKIKDMKQKDAAVKYITDFGSLPMNHTFGDQTVGYLGGLFGSGMNDTDVENYNHGLLKQSIESINKLKNYFEGNLQDYKEVSAAELSMNPMFMSTAMNAYDLANKFMYDKTALGLTQKDMGILRSFINIMRNYQQPGPQDTEKK